MGVICGFIELISAIGIRAFFYYNSHSKTVGDTLWSLCAEILLILYLVGGGATRLLAEASIQRIRKEYEFWWLEVLMHGVIISLVAPLVCTSFLYIKWMTEHSIEGPESYVVIVFYVGVYYLVVFGIFWSCAPSC